MTIIYRTAGAWGAGKGANLSPAEVDRNFWDLAERLLAVERDPTGAVSIDHLSQNGNQLTVHLTNGTTQGPFTLPVAQWRWKGEWQPATIYFALDIVGNGGSIYLVQHNHTSDVVFAADAEDITGFRYGRLIAPPEQPYDVGMFHPAAIPGNKSVLLQHVATRSFVIPIGFADSTAYLRKAVSTENLSLEIRRNVDLIGHLNLTVGESALGDGGQLGTFAGLSPRTEVQFSRTDRLTILAPDVLDATAAGLSITFAARTGMI